MRGRLIYAWEIGPDPSARPPWRVVAPDRAADSVELHPWLDDPGAFLYGLRAVDVRSLSEATRRLVVREQDEARAGAFRIES